MRDREGGRHARVFEGAGRVHALVLGVELLMPEQACAAAKVEQGRIAFPQGDNLAGIVDDRQQIAKTPHTTLVNGC